MPKELTPILENIRSLLQTNTVTASQLLELNKEVMKSKEKIIEQDGINKLFIQRFDTIEANQTKHGVKLDEAVKSLDGVKLLIAKATGIMVLAGPLLFKALDKLWP